MSRPKAGETLLPCGCRHSDRSFVPTRQHPDLGMCASHEAEWRELHGRAGAEHCAAIAEAAQP